VLAFCVIPIAILPTSILALKLKLFERYNRNGRGSYKEIARTVDEVEAIEERYRNNPTAGDPTVCPSAPVCSGYSRAEEA
jgi:hypothetical protein